MVGLNHSFESGIDTDLSYTKELIDILKDGHNYCMKRLQIIPDDHIKENSQIFQLIKQSGGNILSINDPISGVNEIILPKSVLKLIFIGSYQHLYKSEIKKDCNNSEIIAELEYAALGALLMTPTDTTVLNCYYQKVLNLHTDFPTCWKNYFTLSSYLTCNYDKCNKSSSLWLLLRKLFCKLWIQLKVDDIGDFSVDSLKEVTIDWVVENGNKRLLLVSAIQTCLDSITIHPRNYYASTALRFFLSIIEDFSVKKSVILMILRHLSGSSDDYSIWMVVVDSLIDEKDDLFSYHRKMARELGLEVKKSSDLPNLLILEIFGQMKRIAVMSKSYAGFVALFRLDGILKTENFLLHAKTIINKFEHVHDLEIDINKTVFDAAQDFQEKGILKDEYEELFQMKRAISYIQHLNLKRDHDVANLKELR